MERLVHQAHFLYGSHFPLRPRRIAHRDAAAFLSPVLQGKKAVIDRPRHVFSVKIIHAEDAAFLLQSFPFPLRIEFFRHTALS